MPREIRGNMTMIRSARRNASGSDHMRRDVLREGRKDTPKGKSLAGDSDPGVTSGDTVSGKDQVQGLQHSLLPF
jgi:hypothetical protein